MKRDALKNFAQFTGEHLCKSHFLNKVTRPFSYNSFKKETPSQVFSSVNFLKF